MNMYMRCNPLVSFFISTHLSYSRFFQQMVAIVTLSDLLDDKNNDNNSDMYIQLANAIIKHHPSRSPYTNIPAQLEDDYSSDPSMSDVSTDEEYYYDNDDDDDYDDSDTYSCQIQQKYSQTKLAEIPYDELHTIDITIY